MPRSYLAQPMRQRRNSLLPIGFILLCLLIALLRPPASARAVVLSADLAITKTDGVTTVTAGGSTTYTITASNAGPDAATGATVADTFPASLTAIWTCVGAGGGTCTASGSGNINDTVNLPAGSSVTYTASATISASATGTLSNTATVTAPGGVTDPTPGNNSATDSDTIGAQADLAITKTDGVTTATPGGSVTYTITASNAGPSNATGATVADTFPASLTATWTCVGAGGGTCTASGSGNINNTVNLPAGGSVTYTASATISGAATGTLSNTATVTAPGGVTDPTPGNNSATDSDTLASSADLAITKTDGVTTVTAGGSTTYTITASNAGPSNATGATVADTFPASLTATWTCVGAGGGTCTASGSGNINDTVNLPSGGSVTYTASATISGAATGTLSNTATVTAPGGVTDPTPGNNSATDSDTITVANTAPVANNDSYVTPQNTPLLISGPGVLTNDTDANNNLLTAILNTGPSHGSILLNPDGSFFYFPTPGYSGPDSFTYQAYDGTALSNTATVSITIVNTPPVANNDTYAATEDVPLVVAAPGVLANDTDPDGGSMPVLRTQERNIVLSPLTAILVSGPTHGTLTLNADGSFTYTPNANYHGPDSFTYKANDGTDDSNIATVTLTVASVNDVPTATADNYGTPKDTSLTIAAPGVLANDADIDGDALTAVLVSGPSNGILTLNANGSFTYTPNANYIGVDLFSYSVSDGAALSAPTTVSIQVANNATLTTAIEGQGTLGLAPAGGTYPLGTVITLTPQAASGYLFVGWIVDSVPAGWAPTLTITMDRDHAVTARFATFSDFTDLKQGDPAYTPVRELAARGIVRGYGDGRFGPGDDLLRAQAAALVARAVDWDFEDWGNPFTDQGSVDANLWRNVGTLNHYNVARGFGDGTYQPAATVNHAQFISLVTRAMVAKGYWTLQPDDASRFPSVGNTGHRQDLITYLHYVGSFPDLNEGSSATDWFGPASRGWTARALWAALNQYQQTDHTP